MTHKSSGRKRRGLASLRRNMFSPAAGRQDGRRFRLPWGLWFVVPLFGLLIVLAGWRLTQPSLRDRGVPMSAYRELPPGASQDVEWDPGWPELAVKGFPARPLVWIRQAYAYAVRRPDVLRSVPCYCGCERLGHHNTEDCYLRGRSENGVPKWNLHGVTCEVAVDVTRDAIGLTAEHKGIEVVRPLLDRKYFPVFGRTTPTPAPP